MRRSEDLDAVQGTRNIGELQVGQAKKNLRVSLRKRKSRDESSVLVQVDISSCSEGAILY